ncbi:MAG: ABC transporter ATP-binding protein [Clostridia bacterium]|nr:ABC transporter ATP-binding protein [Clostridia bacterium]
MAQVIENAVEFREVTKTFGSLIAVNKVNLNLRKGEILALLGENGSGKTTLVNMLTGLYYPDGGEIYVFGKKADVRSPRDAYDLKIGMVHQHYMLVDVLTAAENIVLGIQGKSKIDLKKLNAQIHDISERYGFDIDPAKKIYDMSVAQKQTVEIVKALYRGADILVLDEPTAVLTPQEITSLFYVLRAMKDDGKSIIIITHKLDEVMAVSDRVAILRRGEYIGVVETAKTDKKELTEMMVGHSVDLSINRPAVEEHELRLDVEGLNCVSPDGLNTLKNVSFSLMSGEILGVAGIAGSGQRELCEAIAGLEKVKSGSIIHHSAEKGTATQLVGLNPSQIRHDGVALAFVPEDRLGMGLVGSLGMVDNMMLKTYSQGKGPFVDRKEPKKLAEQLIDKLAISAPGVYAPVRSLSGGNVQKVLLGREILSKPDVLVVAYPVRGLDIKSSYMVYDMINQEKSRGTGILFVGEDLDVLLELCDRILVLCGGEVSGIVDAGNVTKEQLGLLMTGTGARESEA